jgi:hypothetical protein
MLFLFSFTCFAMEKNNDLLKENNDLSFFALRNIQQMAEISSTIKDGMANQSEEKKELNFKTMISPIPSNISIDNASTSDVKFSYEKEDLFQQILDESPDIIGFKGIGNNKKENLINLCNELKKYEHEYELIFFENYSSDFFINAVAVKIKKFYIGKIRRWWISNNLSDCPEQPVLTLTLYPNIIKKINNKDIIGLDYNKKPIIVTNITDPRLREMRKAKETILQCNDNSKRRSSIASNYDSITTSLFYSYWIRHAE